MWGPGSWMGPMWGFWWILPVIGLLICIFLVIAMARMVSGHGRFMCMGPHHDDGEEIRRLRREVEELRGQMNKHGAAR